MYQQPAFQIASRGRLPIYRPSGLFTPIPRRLPRGSRIAIIPSERQFGLNASATTSITNKNIANNKPVLSYFNYEQVSSPYGVGMVRRGSSDPELGVAEAPSNAFSLECLFMPTVASNNNVLVHFDAGFPATSTHDRDLYVQAGVPKLHIYTGTSLFATSSVSLTAYQLYHLCGVSDGTNIFIYVNGILRGTSAGGTAYPSNNYFIMGDGNIPGGGSSSNGGVMFMASYANVAWTAVEVLARARDPFAFAVFNRDIPKQLFAAPAVGAGPNNAMLQTSVSMGAM